MSDNSEQSIEKSEAEVKNDFKGAADLRAMSFADLEAELKSKDYSKAKVTEQPQKNSETSDESSADDQDQDSTVQSSNEDQDVEQNSNEDSSNEQSSDSETPSDNQKDKPKSKKPFDTEKAYKELQGEFTRRNQKLAELEKEVQSLRANSTKSPTKDEQGTKVPNSKLAQLREKDPEAAAALEELISQEVDSRIKDQIKPVEEQVTLRRRKENTQKFTEALTEFEKSDLAALQPELLAIYNENPAHWHDLILDSDNAFEALKKELFYRHMDKIAEMKAKKSKEAQSNSVKQDRLKNAQVGTKSKTSTPTRDVMSDDDFRSLPLEEMEKRLKKV